MRIKKGSTMARKLNLGLWKGYIACLERALEASNKFPDELEVLEFRERVKSALAESEAKFMEAIKTETRGGFHQKKGMKL